MATTSVSLLPRSGDAALDIVMNGTYWVLGSSRSVTWATANTYPNYWTNPAAGAELISRALSKFEEVANINFQYAGHFLDSGSAPANMVFTGTTLPVLFGQGLNVLAWAYFPNEPLSDSQTARWFGNANVYPNAAGDVWINMSSEAMFYPTYPGSDGFFLLLHEIGHAVGLKHPHDDGGTGRPTATQVGLSPADIQLLTVMSYNEGSPISSWWGGNPGALMPFDILALQWMYGANNSTRVSDSTYGLYDDDVLESFWDAGGRDLATAIDSWTSWTIDLGLFSNVYGHTLGYAKPNYSQTTLKFFFDLENAVGSPYSDTIRGNEAANMLIGLAGDDLIEGKGGNDVLWSEAGNDTLDGGAGADIVRYVGNRSDYTLTKIPSGYRITGPEDTDVLGNIERLEFSDRWVALDLGTNEAANKSVRLMGAAFGASSIREYPDLLGIAIALFDAGRSMLEIMSSIVESSSAMSNGAFVNVVYRNVIGTYPSYEEWSYYTGLLRGSGGSMSQAELLVIAADSLANEFNVDLVGRQQTGVEYLAYA